MDITKSGLTRLLHTMGYCWVRSRTIGGVSVAARIARMTAFVKQLSLEIQEEKSGTAIICYTDESYVNVRRKPLWTWYSPWTTVWNEVGGPCGRGDRLIRLHPITKNGLLGGDY